MENIGSCQSCRKVRRVGVGVGCVTGRSKLKAAQDGRFLGDGRLQNILQLFAFQEVLVDDT